ncbi:hypothetical protein [Kitasatospora sp. NPDC056273]|uniref:hypothetical protein n=1 Tax=Kitasatospora sp. NPDC056273 TaxID=3345769 RepID=UPI0035E2F317
MTTTKTTAPCQAHAADDRANCPTAELRTVQTRLLALLELYADGPLSFDYLFSPDKATRRAIRLLAALLSVPPRAVRRHARGSRWPADRKLRQAVNHQSEEEFCPARLAERAAKQARAEAADARRRAAERSSSATLARCDLLVLLGMEWPWMLGCLDLFAWVWMCCRSAA